MANPSKAQFLTTVHDLLKKRYKPKADRQQVRLSVLEAVVYGVCHEGTTRTVAAEALTRFKNQYFDWNEVRVSSLVEIQQTLEGLPDAEDRARRIRKFLRQMFQKTFGFNLDALVKKPLKEALKVLHEYEAFSSDYVSATVVQQALGGHAMPVDEEIRRVLGRLGVDEPDPAALRGVLERAVPKNRGAEFLDLIEDLAHDVCIPGVPDCPRCDLRKICPYALTHKAEIQAGGAKGGRAKEPPAAKSAKGAAPPPPSKTSPAKAVAKPGEASKRRSGRSKA